MKHLWLCASAAGALAVVVSNLWAMPRFKKEFDTRWIDKNTDADFKETAKKQSCNICHVKGKPKATHNDFGKALEELIPGSAKARLDAASGMGDEAKEAETNKLVEEFKSALEKVERVKAADGSTYGDRLKSHKLPVDPPADGGDEPAVE